MLIMFTVIGNDVYYYLYNETDPVLIYSKTEIESNTYGIVANLLR